LIEVFRTFDNELFHNVVHVIPAGHRSFPFPDIPTHIRACRSLNFQLSAWTIHNVSNAVPV
jgi:hypothetical protein